MIKQLVIYILLGLHRKTKWIKFGFGKQFSTQFGNPDYVIIVGWFPFVHNDLAKFQKAFAFHESYLEKITSSRMRKT